MQKKIEWSIWEAMKPTGTIKTWREKKPAKFRDFFFFLVCTSSDIPLSIIRDFDSFEHHMTHIWERTKYPIIKNVYSIKFGG